MVYAQSLTALPIVPGTPLDPTRLSKRLRPLADVPAGALMVHEIYTSVQGEGTHVGLPCVFVRLTACHLRCTYCDTRQAFGNGRAIPLAEVVAQVQAEGPKLCLITGGEPLLQAQVHPLMTTLCDAGFTVLLETSGSLPTDDVDARVISIIDMKSPSSGEEGANLYPLLSRLRRHDEVKFVLGDEADYAWAKTVVQQHGLENHGQVLFGPVFGLLDPKDLIAWVLRDRLAVRVQVQLHKYIWHPKTQGV